jgi:hypothetical protein
MDAELEAVLKRLRDYWFPGGEEAGRSIRGLRDTQRGELRGSPGAKWMPFTAIETIDATRSRFRWDARMGTGRITVVSATDAYEDGHGWLAIKAGGVVPVKKSAGPDFDKGELQRYLAAIVACPPILLNHASLECTFTAPHTLRLRDREDPTGATVEVDLAEDGRPLKCRAERPRVAGRAIALSAWQATWNEPSDHGGVRVPDRMEAAWQLPEGLFTYFRTEVTSLEWTRDQ